MSLDHNIIQLLPHIIKPSQPAPGLIILLTYLDVCHIVESHSSISMCKPKKKINVARREFSPG